MYENAQMNVGNGAMAAGKIRDNRPHEQAVQNCHELLHKLDAVIGGAEQALAPVTLPVLPESATTAKDLRGCGPATSEVVAAVDGLAERINGLTGRLAALIGRVQV